MRLLPADAAYPTTGGPRAWTRILDYYHASGRLTTIAAAPLGVDTRGARLRAAKMPKTLKQPNGVLRVLHSAAALAVRHLHILAEIGRQPTQLFLEPVLSIAVAAAAVAGRTTVFRPWGYGGIGSGLPHFLHRCRLREDLAEVEARPPASSEVSSAHPLPIDRCRRTATRANRWPPKPHSD